MLTNRVFPQLNTEATKLLALKTFMSQVDNLQVAFSVKQHCLITVQQAVTMALELEKYRIQNTAGRKSELSFILLDWNNTADAKTLPLTEITSTTPSYSLASTSENVTNFGDHMQIVEEDAQATAPEMKELRYPQHHCRPAQRLLEVVEH